MREKRFVFSLIYRSLWLCTGKILVICNTPAHSTYLLKAAMPSRTRKYPRFSRKYASNSRSLFRARLALVAVDEARLTAAPPPNTTVLQLFYASYFFSYMSSSSVCAPLPTFVVVETDVDVVGGGCVFTRFARRRRYARIWVLTVGAPTPLDPVMRVCAQHHIRGAFLRERVHPRFVVPPYRFTPFVVDANTELHTYRELELKRSIMIEYRCPRAICKRYRQRQTFRRVLRPLIMLTFDRTRVETMTETRRLLHNITVHNVRLHRASIVYRQPRFLARIEVEYVLNRRGRCITLRLRTDTDKTVFGRATEGIFFLRSCSALAFSTDHSGIDSGCDSDNDATARLCCNSRLTSSCSLCGHSGRHNPV